MKKKDDFHIWNDFLSGDDHAYEYIYKNHVQKLFLYGMTLTQDEELIKDCIQDIFIRIYKNRKYLKSTDNIRLYLIAALKNTLLNAFRNQKTYQAFLRSFEYEHEEYDPFLNQLAEHEQKADHKRKVDYLWSILTKRQKEIVYYKFIEGLSLDEIAERSNMGYHSAANVIQRALKKMRKFYFKSD